MTLEERFRADEDVVDFLLDRIHARLRWGMTAGKTKPFLRRDYPDDPWLNPGARFPGSPCQLSPPFR
jgi:hypothetical protein